MRLISFTPDCFKDFTNWLPTDKKIYSKINDLIIEILRTPFEGTGNPEALKHEYKGYWSRRINHEHRLVYKVTESEIIFISCKHHY